MDSASPSTSTTSKKSHVDDTDNMKLKDHSRKRSYIITPDVDTDGIESDEIDPDKNTPDSGNNNTQPDTEIEKDSQGNNDQDTASTSESNQDTPDENADANKPEHPPKGIAGVTVTKISEYVTDTTAHGLANVLAGVTIAARIFWFFSILISYGIFIWQVSLLFKYYASNPVLVRQQVSVNQF